MDTQLVTTLEFKGWKAEVFSSEIPGEFKVAYRNGSGELIEEIPLTGISTYKQRESEILDRLKALRSGAAPVGPDRGDSGEY